MSHAEVKHLTGGVRRGAVDLIVRGIGPTDRAGAGARARRSLHTTRALPLEVR
jgi:hypothetical protein